MAGAKTEATAGAGREEEIDMLKKEITDAESALVQTVREIRMRVSYEALKNRALAQVRRTAVQKPARAAGAALITAYGYARKGAEIARENPVLPIVAGIAVLAPLMVARLIRRKRR
jgi:hypothetical protein